MLQQSNVASTLPLHLRQYGSVARRVRARQSNTPGTWTNSAGRQPLATERGIAVGNTPGVLTDSTADMAFCLLIGAALNVGVAWAIAFGRSSNHDIWDIETDRYMRGGVDGIGYRVRTDDHPAEAFESIARI